MNRSRSTHHRRKTKLKIWQANLRKNKTLFHEILQEGLSQDILLLQEPGIHADYMPTHPSWTIVAGHTRRQNREIRAVTLIKTNIIARFGFLQIPRLTTENMVTIQVANMIITNLYNHQDTTPKPLETWLSAVGEISSDQACVIAGDFNLHHPLWQRNVRVTDRQATEWIDWTLENNMYLCSTPGQPTHTRGNVIDLVFAHDDLHISEVQINELVGSDHHLLQWSIALPADQAIFPVSSGPQFNYKKADWDEFKTTLRKNCRGIPTTSSNYNTKYKLDQRAKELQTSLQEAIVSSIPPLKITTRSKRWWTAELNVLKTTRKEKYALWKQIGSEAAKQDFQQAQEKFTQGINKAKTTHWNEYLQSLSGNDIWQATAYTKPRPSRGIVSQLRRQDGTYTQNFAEYEQEMRAAHFAPTPQDHLDVPPLRMNKRWPRVKTLEIAQALRTQAPTKAPGPDTIKTVALQYAWKTHKRFRKILKQLIQGCLKLGYHPQTFRQGHTVVIPKPGKDHSLASSYRPITLLNTIGKLIEKIVQKRLLFLVDRQLPSNQYGSRPGYSAPDALTKLVTDIEKAKFESLTTSILAIDIKGAFDNVNHAQLIRNLNQLNLPPAVILWISSFLNWRSTSLIIDRKITPMTEVQIGIPQGSPISPLLFLIYTRQLYEELNAVKNQVIGYVDDITIYVHGTNPNNNTIEIQKILNKCHQMAEELHIKFDYGPKLGWMHIKPQRTRKKLQSLELKLPNGELRSPTTELKLLGLTIDHKLTFQKHASIVVTKAKQRMGAIGRLGGINQGITGQSLRHLYLGSVRPLFEYSSHMWYPKLTKAIKEDIQRIQNLGLRKALGAFRTNPIVILHRDLHVSPIEYRQHEIIANSVLRMHTNVHPRNPVRKLIRHPPVNTTLKQITEEFDKNYLTAVAPFWNKKPPWLPAAVDSKDNIHAKIQMKKDIKDQQERLWELEYQTSEQGRHYRTYTNQKLYGADNVNPLKKILKHTPRNLLSQITQLRSGHGNFGEYFQRWQTHPEKKYCTCGTEDTVLHKLLECPHHDGPRLILREFSHNLNLSRLLDTSKGLEKVLRFLLSIR